MPAGPQTPSKRSLFMLSALSTATLSLVFVGSISAVQTNGLGGSPGALADSCGALAQPGPQGQGSRGMPVFPPGQYPVKLPAVSLLGARNDLPNRFRAGVHWGQLPDGRKWGSTAGVSAAPDGRTIWAIDRCGASGAGGTACADSPFDPVLQFDPAGRLLKSFGRGMIVSPHKITVDRDGNVWVADNGSARGKGQQVLKFSPDGRLLTSLGKAGVAGSDFDEFDQPTEVAVAPNGDIFVADGHSGGGTATGNARIMKFDKNGKFIKAWGRKGMGPGEFDVPHTIAFDSKGRLFVGDRQNNRIQIFDQHRTIRSAADWLRLQSWHSAGHSHRERKRRLRQVLHPRCVSVPIPQRVEHGRRRHSGLGRQRLWCRLPRNYPEVRQEMIRQQPEHTQSTTRVLQNFAPEHWYPGCNRRGMTNSCTEVQRSISKFKHVQASSIWAFVRDNGELNYEEHNHLRRCKHCDAIFKYFAIYAETSRFSEAIEDHAKAA